MSIRFEPTTFGFLDLSEREVDALLIWPKGLGGASLCYLLSVMTTQQPLIHHGAQRWQCRALTKQAAADRDRCSQVCLLFYVLAIAKVISGQVPTCDSAHSCSFIVFPRPSYQHHDPISYTDYPDTVLTSPRYILLMSSARVGNDKYGKTSLIDHSPVSITLFGPQMIA